MLALASVLHRRLGAESVMFRLDDNLLKLIWEQVDKMFLVLAPPDQEEEEEAWPWP